MAQKFVPTDEPLFPDEPKLEDINQGAIGDCYLMAGLGSIVKREPKVIKRAILDNGDGTVTVRLFDRQPTKPVTFTEKFIRFEKSILESDEGNHAKDTLWVQMLEKAYAIHAKEKDAEQGSFVKLDAGGHSHDVFEALLGRPSRNQTMKGKDCATILLDMERMVRETKTTEEDAAEMKRSLLSQQYPEAAVDKIVNGLIGKSYDESRKNLTGTLGTVWNEVEKELENAKVADSHIFVALSKRQSERTGGKAIDAF